MPEMSSELLRGAAASDWPGNVRELENYIERLLTLTPGLPAPTSTADLETPAAPARGPAPDSDAVRDRASLLVEALQRTGGNQSRAARELGLSRSNRSISLRKYAYRTRRNQQFVDFGESSSLVYGRNEVGRPRPGIRRFWRDRSRTRSLARVVYYCYRSYQVDAPANAAPAYGRHASRLKPPGNTHSPEVGWFEASLHVCVGCDHRRFRRRPVISYAQSSDREPLAHEDRRRHVPSPRRLGSRCGGRPTSV